MIKKAAFLLGVLAGSITVTAHSTTMNMMIPGMSLEYELLPNESQTMVNFFFWTVKADCTLASNAEQTPIAISMLRKTASVKNIPLKAGDSIQIGFNSGETFTVTADSGAKVELTNKGDDDIKVACESIS